MSSTPYPTPPAPPIRTVVQMPPGRADRGSMDRLPPTGVHRPRRWGRGRHGAALSLAVVAVLAVVLWVAAAGHLAASASLSGLPTSSASVVGCPPPGASGRCDVRLAEPGDPVVPLEGDALWRPSVGDQFSVALSPEGVASPHGWRAWSQTLVLLGLAVTLTGWAVGRWRRLLEAGTPGIITPAHSTSNTSVLHDACSRPARHRRRDIA